MLPQKLWTRGQSFAATFKVWSAASRPQNLDEGQRPRSVAGQARDGAWQRFAGRRSDDATSKAQDMMYEASERTTSHCRIALARKALGISPLCADAYEVITGPESRRCCSASDPARTSRRVC